MSEAMEFCSHCEKTLPGPKFDLHMGYCRRNIRKCEDCHRPYDINEAEEHQEQFHSFGECQHCGIKVPSKQLQEHVGGCIAKPVACVYCELPIPTDKFDEHRIHCESRTRNCEMCARPIMNKEYFQHLDVCQGPVSLEQPHHSNSSSQNYSEQFSEQFGLFSNFSNFGTFGGLLDQPGQTVRSYTRMTTTNPLTGEVIVNQQSNNSPLRERRQPRSLISNLLREQMMRPSYLENSFGGSNYSPHYGLQNGVEQLSEADDPELQAALMASLGYQDQNANQGSREFHKK